MENEQRRDIAFKKFTWIIQNFSKTNTKKLRSKAFEVGGCRWRILVHPIGKGVDHLSLFLKVADSLPSYGWTKFAHFKLALINQMDTDKSVVKETQQKFNAGYSSWGASFVHLSDFYNTNKGYLVNNACIIEAQVSISDAAFIIQDNLTKTVTQTKMEPIELEDQGIDSSNEIDTPCSTSPEFNWNQADQTELELLQQKDQGTIGPSDETPTPKQIHYVPTAPPLYPSIYHELEQVPLTPLTELIDFKSLGPEEVAFFPLLVEVCSWHPSLIERQRKRSPKFVHWAFIALGQVLYFLDTMKAKDMSEDACKHLQGLWEELQFFGFDLTWLEPYVQSALGVKAYLEREEQVRKLKDKVAALEIEMKKLEAELSVAEVDLKVAKRNLAKEENGFEERNIDAELGYGIF